MIKTNVIKKQSGFTLIEILIAVVILTFLGIFCSQSIQNSIKFKQKFQGDIDRLAQTKSAINIIERDINLAFHHRDVIGELYKQVQSEAIVTPPQNPGSTQVVAPTTAPAEAKNYTVFMGEANKIAFTSRSNVRMVMDSPESDQAKVGYELKSCKSIQPDAKITEANCIYRRNSPYIDADVTKGGDEQVLLEGVKEFKLQYLEETKKEWVSRWDGSENGGDILTRKKFPLAVEITIVSDLGNSREVTLQTVAGIRYPNNPTESPPPSVSPSITPPKVGP